MSTSGTLKIFFLLLFFTGGIRVNLYSQVLINEILASNATIITDKDYGKYCDWIELYNTTTRTIDLGGYFLTDDTVNLSMWQFPAGSLIAAHSYFLVYADELGKDLHTNFQLSKEGEMVLLVNQQMAIVDSFSFPYQLTDISYGRMWNDPLVIGYFNRPTPGKMNNIVVRGISPTPVFSVSGGFYTGEQTVEISVTSQYAEIFYTLDGTEPTTASLRYNEPIIINSTSVLRVKSFEKGFLPGLTITQTYFIDEPMNLPVISLVTDPDNFFSDETGIYVQGTAGIPGYCTSVPHNVNQDWERPVNIELFEKDGTTGLNQLAGAKIFGGCSRVRYPIKSLAFYARKEYETSSFSYQLFPDKPSNVYETFILRTSADDQPYTMFRDALAHMVVKDAIDIDVMAYRPVVLYINGKYWGIHNMREKINEYYPGNNFGVNADSVDMLERNPEESWNTISGSADNYNAMIDYLHNNDITQSSHYDYISRQMDIDEYINYQVTQIFLGGRDWPGNNIKFWRSNEKPYDRWRWILCDLDFTFTEFFSDIMDEATKLDCGCTWPNPSWSTYLFRRLLENKTFRDEFIHRFFLYSETCFSRERIHGIIDKLQSAIAPEIPRHIERWGGQKTNLPDNTWVTPIFSSVEKWEENVQRMRDFTDTRHEMAKKHVMDYFGISGLNGFTANVEPANLGNVKVGNALITNTSVSADICSGQTLEVSCIPEPGYILSNWEVTRKQENDSTLIRRSDSWRYLESWWDPAPDWTALNYDDGYWDTENAEFGYGDGDEATVIGYGGDPQNKMITAWFRKKFTIEDKTVFTRYTLHLLRDDGARVYLNGMEVIRDNLDRWWTGGNSPARNDIDGTAETDFNTFQLNPALFREGENIIAVEIHQSSANSDDLSFDMDLIATHLNDVSSEIYTESRLSLDLTGNTAVTAHIIADTNVVESVFINEVMAKNSSGFTDENGEYEDWIELYNKGIVPVDLAGLYVSDTLSARKACQIPEGFPALTTIYPNNFLVFVADNEPSEGILHVGFRLAKEGDEIALMQIIGNDTLIVDYLKFGTQDENISWGRYPDGSGSFEFMPVSTPLATNIREPVDINSFTDPSASEEILIYPVPTDGRLFIKFNDQFHTWADVVQINIYSGTGRLVSMTQHQTSDLIELSLINQPGGLYLLRIITGNEVFDRRFVVF
jgi:hypothetical protein